MVLLDRNSKKILKKITFLYRSGENVTDILLHEHLPKMTIAEIQSSLTYLRGNDLIDYKYIHTDPVVIYIDQVSYHAGKMREFRWLEIKSFLLRSILTPIGVSAITTLVTLWLNGFFN